MLDDEFNVSAGQDEWAVSIKQSFDSHWFRILLAANPCLTCSSHHCASLAGVPGAVARSTSRDALRGTPKHVLLVSNGREPVDDLVLRVCLVDGQVDHQPVGRGPVPVFLVGIEEDAVAGSDDLDWTTASLAQADTFGDEHRLAQRVPVPVGAGTGHEVNQVRGDAGRRRCGGDLVDVHVAGEPVGRSSCSVD